MSCADVWPGLFALSRWLSRPPAYQQQAKTRTAVTMRGGVKRRERRAARVSVAASWRGLDCRNRASRDRRAEQRRGKRVRRRWRRNTRQIMNYKTIHCCEDYGCLRLTKCASSWHCERWCLGLKEVNFVYKLYNSV